MDVNGKHAALFKEQGQVPAWSPDGSHVALLNTAGNIEMTDPDGSHPRKVLALTSGSQVVALTWSPDGMQLAYTIIKRSKSPLYVVNIDGSNPTQVQEFNGYSLTLVWMRVPSELVGALPCSIPTSAPTPVSTPTS